MRSTTRRGFIHRGLAGATALGLFPHKASRNRCAAVHAKRRAKRCPGFGQWTGNSLLRPRPCARDSAAQDFKRPDVARVCHA